MKEICVFNLELCREDWNEESSEWYCPKRELKWSWIFCDCGSLIWTVFQDEGFRMAMRQDFHQLNIGALKFENSHSWFTDYKWYFPFINNKSAAALSDPIHDRLHNNNDLCLSFPGDLDDQLIKKATRRYYPGIRIRYQSRHKIPHL
jgi:hypothetical protein